jgi:hypothetical protein
MPFTHGHAVGDAAFVNQRLGRFIGSARVTLAIAPSAGRHNVVRRVQTAISSGDEMLGRAF